MKRSIVSFLIAAALVITTSFDFQVNALSTYAVEDSEVIKGSLVIVGGALGSTNGEVYNKFIELAGGKDKAKIGIIPAASSNLKSSTGFKSELINYGVLEKNIEILPIAMKDDPKTVEDESKWIDNADKEEIAERVNELTAIWFVGGDQERITKCLLKADGTSTRVLEAIWNIYREGAVLGGTSAGAAVMSNPMMLGGESLGALLDGVVSSDANLNKYEFEPAMITTGLGFFKYGIVDQHFDKRARYGRLIVTASEKGDISKLAYGIDENTAMIVDNSTKTAQVVGAGGITLIDLSKAVKSTSNRLFNMTGIRISYITKGDTLNLSTKEINISGHKDTTNGYEYYNFESPVNTGVFTGHGLLKDFLSYNLVDNAGSSEVTSYAYDNSGNGFELSFKKDSSTQGYWGYKDITLDDYSFTNVLLDIKPIRVKINPLYESAQYNVEKISSTMVDTDDIKGKLVIVGGALGSSTRDIYDKFIELAGGSAVKIGIIPAASSSLSSSKKFKNDLVNYGVSEAAIEILPIHRSNNWNAELDNLDTVNKIKECSAIWFVGGDQTKITKALIKADGSNTLALEAIWDIYKKGAVIGGTSAGAAIMSEIMIAGGDSLGALNEGFTTEYSSSDQQEYGPVYIEKGLGFFKYGIVDQHFNAKARLGRLIKTSYEKGDKSKLSFGIDENTAMIFDNKTRNVEILGKGGVTVVDVSKAGKNLASSRIDMKDAAISYIVKGDKLNLAARKYDISSSKDTTVGYEYGEYKAHAVTGLFSSHGTVRDLVSYDLIDDSKANKVTSYCFDKKGKGSIITFRKTKQSEGFWGYTDGNLDDYSFINIMVDIKPADFSIN